MSVELIKSRVDVNEMTRKEGAQIVKERDLIVPDGKPDMQRVLYLEGKVDVDQIDAQQDRVVYKGQVEVTVLYVGDNNRNMHTMKGIIPLEDFIIVEGVDSEQKVELDYTIEHMHWNILNERKLNVKAILEMTATAPRNKEITLVTGIDSKAPVQTRKAKVDIISQSSSKEEKLIVKDELTVMQGKSSIGEILKMNTDIREEQIKRTDNEILFNGIVEITTLYKSQEDDTNLEVIKHRVPFAGSADAVRSEEETAWECELEVKPTHVGVNPDYDGEDRIIEVECIVTARYNTFEKVSEEIVEDIYCPGKRIDTKGNLEEYMTLANRADVISVKKDVLQLPDTTAEENEIFEIQAKAIIDDKNIKDDKLTINGMLEVKTTYTNKLGGNPVETTMSMIPFSQEIAVGNMDRKAYPDIKVIPKDIQVLNQGRGEVSIEYTLNYIANLYTKGAIDIIEEVDLVDMDKQELGSYPSITVYVVKKGDSLWNVAKRFNTTVEDVVEINGMEDDSKLHQGQKIIILKKTKF